MRTAFFIHGIGPAAALYSEPLASRIVIEKKIELNWAEIMRPTIRDYARRFPNRPKKPWRLIYNARQRLVQEAETLALYVLLYAQRAVRELIVGDIIRHMEAEMMEEGNRIVLIGHSLGSVIALDALMRFWDAGLMEEKIEAFVTLGSPVHLWCPVPRIRGHVADMNNHGLRWLNIYDEDDPIAEPLGGFHTHIRDRHVNTGGLIRAHVGYWQSQHVADHINSFIEPGLPPPAECSSP